MATVKNSISDPNIVTVVTGNKGSITITPNSNTTYLIQLLQQLNLFL